eukprot:6848249-Alexandrium_andersonii.AAC.1
MTSVSARSVFLRRRRLGRSTGTPSSSDSGGVGGFFALDRRAHDSSLCHIGTRPRPARRAKMSSSQ